MSKANGCTPNHEHGDHEPDYHISMRNNTEDKTLMWCSRCGITYQLLCVNDTEQKVRPTWKALESIEE
jgi:hypothetical protein